MLSNPDFLRQMSNPANMQVKHHHHQQQQKQFKKIPTTLTKLYK